MDIKKRIALTLLALVGLGLSIELCVVFYNANFVENAQPSICAINELMDCDGVAKTAHSQFLGIPLSLWGVCLYIFFLFMTFVDKLQNIKFLEFLKVFKNQTSYIYCIGLLSFIISMILGCISILKINSICIFCFMTYFVNLIIALVAKNWGSGALFEIKNSINDFVEAIKVKRYAFWFSLLVILFISIVTYTSVSNVLSPHMQRINTMKTYFKNFKDITYENEMGPKDATLVIHEFIDFNCSACFIANLYLHRIVDEFENVKVVQHNLPLEKVCNYNMQFEGHSGSCLKSQYALAAKKQGRYWEMADILFGQNIDTEKQIIQEARLIDFDIKKLKQDAYSEEIKNELKEAIKEADSRAIDGTPTLFIGMKKVVGIGTFEELKRIIIEEGGREKGNNE